MSRISERSFKGLSISRFGHTQERKKIVRKISLRGIYPVTGIKRACSRTTDCETPQTSPSEGDYDSRAIDGPGTAQGQQQTFTLSINIPSSWPLRAPGLASGTPDGAGELIPLHAPASRRPTCSLDLRHVLPAAKRYQ